MHIMDRTRGEGRRMEKKFFGTTKEGAKVTEYTMENASGMCVSVIDLGATITSVKVKGNGGKLYDVVLGYDNLVDYQNHTYYFGAAIGRNANRIDHAKITLDGRSFALEANDNENNLHSGTNGFHAMLWEVEREEPQSITFCCLSRDGEQDFPGNMTAKVTYTLTDEDELVIAYEAVSDQTTVANFTNHSYFNLDGHTSGSVEEQELEILASYYTPVIDSKAIPTGEIVSVAGTPMDFREMKKIGAEIGADFDQLIYAGGYDHNYVLDKADGSMQLAARARAVHSGICMDVYTDCVGIQFYAGNFVENHTGKEGASYGFRHGFCLETQYFPNAVNEKNFKAPLLRPGETYRSNTKYCFKCVE